jgi:hypothetical protein
MRPHGVIACSYHFVIAVWREKRAESRPVKYWEIIARNLKKRGWSLGYVSAIDSEGRTIGLVDAHRDDGKRFVVHADEKLTAFLELEAAIRTGSGLRRRMLRRRHSSKIIDC